MLDNQLNSVNHNFRKFNDLKKVVQDLNTGLKEIELIRADPSNYVYEYFKELNRQVDLTQSFTKLKLTRMSLFKRLI